MAESTTLYFGPTEEEKFCEYIKEKDPVRKNEIYNTYLKNPFIKMTECIVRKYDLYTPNERFEDTVNDIISYLITVADKYNPEKSKRAFSYCQTIVKNTALAKRVSEYKRILRDSPIETHWSIGEGFDDDEQVFHDGEILSAGGTDVLKTDDNEIADFSLNMDNDDEGEYTKHLNYVDKMFIGMTEQVKDMINDPEEYGLNDDDIKVGRALAYCMEKWSQIIPENENISPKHVKSAMLFTLKENTLLDEGKIRKSLQKYKAIYSIMSEKIQRRTIYQ